MDKSEDIDRLLADQRQRWRNGERVLVEEYLRDHPALAANTEAVLLLINNEVVLREGRGEKPDRDEYLRRFEQLADDVRILFEVHRAVESGDLDDVAADTATYIETSPPDHAAHPRDVGELLDRLRRSGLLSAAQQKELDDGLARRFAEPRALARELVR